ncbi:hypothetical protein CCR75_009273 [Bremia lactucae]|uniref:Reverse transcriptase RNase H-like domain-containing protein n=1 Tax=Bremia lactucae TaxID=4779 RepID=A0A976FE27_BRELC|nr:hypothetical protein CCR75_009273 [Bremia lactucae]
MEALRQLPAPSTGQELQQFICALNWMRSSLPAYNRLVHLLSIFTEKVYASAGGRKKTQAITQVPTEYLQRGFADQHHEPLMMLSGTFSGGAKRWAIVEKEAYAIVETCKRADYLVRRPDGFSLYTDHRICAIFLHQQ